MAIQRLRLDLSVNEISGIGPDGKTFYLLFNEITSEITIDPTNESEQEVTRELLNRLSDPPYSLRKRR